MAPRSQSKVYFFYEGVSLGLRNRPALKSFIERVFQKERMKLDSLVYVFCTDQKLLKINKEYLDHDDYTDIITFQLSDRNSPVIGEIYISVQRVRENSRRLGVSFISELHRVIFHGVLHLCGHTDKTAAQKRQIRATEDHYLKLYFKSFT